MNTRAISKEIEILEKKCSAFLTTQDFSDEQKQELMKIPHPLKIKTFNGTINTCKDQLQIADKAKIDEVLSSFYELRLNSLSGEEVSKKINEFLGRKLESKSLKVSEIEISKMNKIISNLDYLFNLILNEQKALQKRGKKWYVFNKTAQKRLLANLQSLHTLKSKIEFQIEYNSKQIADSIIEDFCNIYIFFAYTAKMLIMKNEQLLNIELANFLDRYINIIKQTFNKRQLKSQDMLYYYASYELNELKSKIYENLNDYKVL